MGETYLSKGHRCPCNLPSTHSFKCVLLKSEKQWLLLIIYWFYRLLRAPLQLEEVTMSSIRKGSPHSVFSVDPAGFLKHSLGSGPS